MPTPITGAITKIDGIHGLTTSLQSAGVLLGFRNAVPGALSAAFGGGTTDTSRVRFTTNAAANAIRLVYCNFFCQSGNPEQDGANAITISASIEDPTTINGSINGTAQLPVTFHGSRTTVLSPGAMVVSDPTYCEVPANWALMVRTAVTVGAGEKYPYCGYQLIRGLGAGSLNPGGNLLGGGDGGGNGEGVTTGSDQTYPNTGTVTNSGGSQQAYTCSAILGNIVGQSQPSLFYIGHSVPTGTNDQQGMGWVMRACSALNVACVKACLPGEKIYGASASTGACEWITNRYRRMQLINIGTNAALIHEITNDTATATAAQIEGALLVLAKAFAFNGYKTIIVCTEVPKTTSTDSWQTADHQTVITGESVRVAVNTYLRAPASAGAGNSATFDFAAAGVPFTLCDIAALIEVNSSNVLTLNGSFWQVQAPAFSGTASASNSSTGATFTDTRQAWTTNQWIGYSCLMTTSGVTTQCVIAKNSGTVLTFAQNAPTVDATTTYVIEAVPVGPSDGTHPTGVADSIFALALTAGMLEVR